MAPQCPAQPTRFQFTLNNPRGFQPNFACDTNVGFAAWQYEIGPTCGTPHLQGVVFLRKPRAKDTLNRKYFDNRAHFSGLDNVDGTIDYCTREFNSDGTRKRAPLSDEITDAGPWYYPNADARRFAVKAGSHKRRRDYDIPDDIPALITAVQDGDIHVTEFCANQRYINARDMYGLKRDWQTKCLVLWGKSGTGKSTLAEHLWPKAYYAQKEHGTTRSQGKLWFDGYDKHDVVIIDDYHYTLSLTQFKELVSKNGHHVPCKGSKVPFLAKLVVILSNDSPDDWWPNQVATEHYRAAQRRMDPPIGMVKEINTQLVTYYEQDGRPRRRWEQAAIDLSFEIKAFIEYDNRNVDTDNNAAMAHLHTPVPLRREPAPSSPTPVDSATEDEVLLNTPPDNPIPPRVSPSPEPRISSSQQSVEVVVNSSRTLRSKRRRFIPYQPQTQ